MRMHLRGPFNLFLFLVATLGVCTGVVLAVSLERGI